MSVYVENESCVCSHPIGDHDDDACYCPGCECTGFVEDVCRCGHDSETHHEMRGVMTAGMSDDGCSVCICAGYEVGL